MIVKRYKSKRDVNGNSYVCYVELNDDRTVNKVSIPALSTMGGSYHLPVDMEITYGKSARAINKVAKQYAGRQLTEFLTAKFI